MTTALITSKVGRKPIAIPRGVEVHLNNQLLSVKGPRGQLEMTLHPFVQAKLTLDNVSVVFSEDKQEKITGTNKRLYHSIVGTTRARLNNMIHGVAHGYERRLTLVGVGYRAQAKGKTLSLSLGYSHSTDYALPIGVTIDTPTQTEIVIKGSDKELVGKVATTIKRYRPVEPYKGKGVRDINEVVELKETKKK